MTPIVAWQKNFNENPTGRKQRNKSDLLKTTNG